jgi:hypothetical protein
MMGEGVSAAETCGCCDGSGVCEEGVRDQRRRRERAWPCMLWEDSQAKLFILDSWGKLPLAYGRLLAASAYGSLAGWNHGLMVFSVRRCIIASWTLVLALFSRQCASWPLPPLGRDGAWRVVLA